MRSGAGMAAWPVARGNKISVCASSRPDKQVKTARRNPALSFLSEISVSEFPQSIHFRLTVFAHAAIHCLCLLLCAIEAGDLLDSVKRRFSSHH